MLDSRWNGLQRSLLVVAVASVLAVSGLLVSSQARPGASASGPGTAITAPPPSSRLAPAAGSGAVPSNLLSGVGPAAAGRFGPSDAPSYQATVLLSNGTVYPRPANPGEGEDPVSLAFDSASGQFLVANFDTANLSIVSTLSDSVLAQIPTCAEPDSLVYDSDDGTVFVACYANSSVVELSATTGRVLANLSVPSEPDALAYDNVSDQVFVVSIDSTSDAGALTILDATNGSKEASVPVGDDPDAVVYDPVDDTVFVGNNNPGYQHGTVSELSLAAPNAVVTVEVGAAPDGLAYASGPQEVVVASGDGTNLTLLSAETGQVISNLSVGASTGRLVYDPVSNVLFVSEASEGAVVALNASTGSKLFRLSVPETTGAIALDPLDAYLVVAQGGPCDVYLCADNALDLYAASTGTPTGRVGLSADPVAAVFAPDVGRLFVADGAADLLYVLADSNWSEIATVPLSGVPYSLAYGDGEVFVGVVGSAGYGKVVILSADNDTVVGTVSIGLGADPSAMVYDGDTSVLYVANAYGAEVFLLAPTNATVIGSVSVPGYPETLAYDAAAGEVFVGVWGLCPLLCGNVTVLADTNGSVVARIPLGSLPLSLAYDAASDLLYVSTLDGTVDIVGTLSNAVLGSVGSEDGAVDLAYDPFDNLVLVADSVTNSIDAVLGGTGEIVASVQSPGAAAGGLAVDPSTGFAAGANTVEGSVSIVAPAPVAYPLYYQVQFVAEGLPNVTYWNVTLDGITVQGTSSMLLFTAQNGTYPYIVSSVGDERVVSPAAAGNITIAGASQLIPVRFAHAKTFTLTFLERGLPPNTHWCITFSRTTCSGFNGISVLDLSPGTYPYSIGGLVGQAISAKEGRTPISLAGYLVVKDHSVTVTLTYVYNYTVTFQESGLPSGTSWSVRLDGVKLQSDSAALATELSNGSYRLSIAKVKGFRTTGAPREIVVDGASVTVEIVFTPRG